MLSCKWYVGSVSKSAGTVHLYERVLYAFGVQEELARSVCFMEYMGLLIVCVDCFVIVDERKGSTVIGSIDKSVGIRGSINSALSIRCFVFYLVLPHSNQKERENARLTHHLSQ